MRKGQSVVHGGVEVGEDVEGYESKEVIGREILGSLWLLHRGTTLPRLPETGDRQGRDRPKRANTRREQATKPANPQRMQVCGLRSKYRPERMRAVVTVQRRRRTRGPVDANGGP